MRLILILLLLTSAAPVRAATFSGAFWDADMLFGGLSDALSFMESNPPSATFYTDLIDYPAGAASPVPSHTTLAAFLGPDAASLSGAHDATLEMSVFRFAGQVAFTPGPTMFTVGSDDGFVLRLDGVDVASFDGNRPYLAQALAVDVAALSFVELIYYENQIRTGVELSWSDVRRELVISSLPGALGFALTAIAGFAVLRLGARFI